MQGERVEPSIIAALDAINAERDDWDVVVIIRGGGATSDLSGFDTYLLAASCAQFPLPIITGIGHERDDTVIDSVAHTRVKTPTAAAEFLVAGMKQAADHLEARAYAFAEMVRKRLEEEKDRLAQLAGKMPQAVAMRCLRESHRLEDLGKQLQAAAAWRMKGESHRLALLQQQLQALSPEHLLKRGYSIMLKGGKAVKNPAEVAKDDVLTVVLWKGKMEVTPK